MSRVSATAVVNGRLYCPPRTSRGARSVCRSSMIRGAPRITTRVIAFGSSGCPRLNSWIAATTACWVTWVAYDFSDGGSMAHSMPRPSTSFSIRWRREGVEIPVAALEDGRRTPHALPGEQRALQPELAGAPEVQTLGVAAAPRELE